MSKIINFIKNNDITLPVNLGILLSKIPYSFRPGVGKAYQKQINAIERYKSLDINRKKEYIYNQFYKIFHHAYFNVPFYSNLYKQHGIEVSDIKTFDDIRKVPIISKSDLINVALKQRSFPVKNRLLVNTGGSSGRPLSFYMDPRRYGNEWAHIHHIWSKLGYSPKSIKLGFDGRSSVKNYVQYDFARNTFRIDIYAEQKDVCDRLIELCMKYNIEFLHGYPSAISEFAIHCEKFYPKLTRHLQSTLKGAFLSSEYPAPHYRNVIEKTFKIKTQAFYGHTETCVFAEETEKFDYLVHQTYGFAEAAELDGNKTLVGTSYFNYASPLIRYDTRDLIEVTSCEFGLLKSFYIKEGRRGDYILDKNSTKIPLTGLVFGRHHKLFDYCSHIQLQQIQPGQAIVYYVSSEPLTSVNSLFDSKNVNIDFQFRQIDRPILTASGKLKLLVTK